jgi:heterotetrameric sarcosine oxidase gamma subunit
VKLRPRTVFGGTVASRAKVPGFQGQDTTLLECADVGCLLVSSAIESSALTKALETLAGFAFPPTSGSITEATTRRALWLTPRSWLVHCPIDEEQILATRINQAFPDNRIHAAVYTDNFCWFDLCGPQALSLLIEGGFISLEREGQAVGRAKRTRLGAVPVVVLHDSFQSWLLGTERSSAIYFADWLQSAVERSTFLLSLNTEQE